MKIGNITLKNNLFLAPMAGITDVGFRAVCKQFGAGLTFTEMVSAKGLLYGSEATEKLLATEENETPKAVQLFGSDPDVFAKIAKHKSLAKFDIIDINMGCPAPKIIKNKEGSFLMTDFELAEKIIKTCVQNFNGRPVTVKMRLGFKDIAAVEFAKMCERAGAAMITVHGRTTKQGYAGKANWAEIAKVVAAVNIPVCANGDVADRKSYDKILAETGAAAVMIGRASCGKPWIFSDILNQEETQINKHDIMQQHVAILKKHNSLHDREVRKHFAWIVKGEKNSTDLRQRMFGAVSLDQCFALLQDL